jgi:hypothetical protein
MTLKRVRTEAGAKRFNKDIGEAINPATSEPYGSDSVHYPWSNPTVPPSFDDVDRNGPFGAMQAYALGEDGRTPAARRKDVEQ